MTAAERHRLVAELMRDEWHQIPLDFEWTPAVVAEVDRLHRAGEDHAVPDPSAHFRELLAQPERLATLR